MPIVDSDESYTYHSRSSGQRGLIRVSKSSGVAELMVARGRFSAAVPPRAAAEGSIAESLRSYAAAQAARDESSDYAPTPPSPWGDPKPMKPWSPPPLHALSEGDFAPMPDEPNWQALRSKPAAKPAAPVDFDGYAPLPRSPWD